MEDNSNENGGFFQGLGNFIGAASSSFGSYLGYKTNNLQYDASIANSSAQTQVAAINASTARGALYLGGAALLVIGLIAFLKK